MTTPANLLAYCEDLGRRARAAACLLAPAPGARKNHWLTSAAAALERHTDELLQANAHDVGAAEDHDLTATQVDRLRLTPARIKAAAEGLREVAALPDPI